MRGVGDVIVTAGPAPVVRYELDDVEHEVRCRLVVAADGRASSVRRQLGLTLTQTEPKTMGGGMLIEGLDDWPAHRMALGTEDDLHYLVFPREGGIARLYQMCSIEQKARFTGPTASRSSWTLPLALSADRGADRRRDPGRPVRHVPMNDSWTERVAVPGVVLIGDAAGWNDPIIGEGLSIGLRDARTVAEIVTGGADWSAGAFDGYEAERRERMRRLCIGAQLETALRCDFTPRAGPARRASCSRSPRTRCWSAPTLLSWFGGPEPAPPEAFEDANIERILALG